MLPKPSEALIKLIEPRLILLPVFAQTTIQAWGNSQHGLSGRLLSRPCQDVSRWGSRCERSAHTHNVTLVLVETTRQVRTVLPCTRLRQALFPRSPPRYQITHSESWRVGDKHFTKVLPVTREWVQLGENIYHGTSFSTTLNISALHHAITICKISSVISTYDGQEQSVPDATTTFCTVDAAPVATPPPPVVMRGEPRSKSSPHAESQA